MKTTTRGVKKGNAPELEVFDRRRVDVSKFTPDLSPKKLNAMFQFPGGLGVSWLAIDLLGVTKTVGKGRTNLTFIRPTIVQADAATPYAGFDIQLSPSRNPAISMHFEPSAYGIPSASSFLIVFAIECSDQTTFNLSGYAGPGNLTNTGAKALSGKNTVTLGFNNVPPSQQTWGLLEQTAGSPWNFYSAEARFPFPVFEP